MNFIEKILQEVYNTDIQFPNSLKNIKPKVQRFFAYGDLNLLKKTSIAVIGSRNCSEYGKKIAKKLTSELVANDIVIVSGMARGIDSVAHETCLEFGGKTIAVLGSGFKNIYPKENTELFYKIIDNGGLVISEFSLEEPVQMKNFPKRNRIISGLSDGLPLAAYIFFEAIGLVASPPNPYTVSVGNATSPPFLMASTAFLISFVSILLSITLYTSVIIVYIISLLNIKSYLF